MKTSFLHFTWQMMHSVLTSGTPWKSIHFHDPFHINSCWSPPFSQAVCISVSAEEILLGSPLLKCNKKLFVTAVLCLPPKPLAVGLLFSQCPGLESLWPSNLTLWMAHWFCSHLDGSEVRAPSNPTMCWGFGIYRIATVLERHLSQQPSASFTTSFYLCLMCLRLSSSVPSHCPFTILEHICMVDYLECRVFSHLNQKWERKNFI